MGRRGLCIALCALFALVSGCARQSGVRFGGNGAQIWPPASFAPLPTPPGTPAPEPTAKVRAQREASAAPDAAQAVPGALPVFELYTVPTPGAEPTPAPTEAAETEEESTESAEEAAEDAPPTPAALTQRDALHASGSTYTVAWLSDTQHYSARYQHIYPLMTSFLAANAARMNLSYIVHTGDIVHSRSSESQWELAHNAHKHIDHIPNGVLAGNHDARYHEGSSQYYEQYFGAHRYEDKAWYGAAYANNRGHYDLVDIGGIPFIFVYMSYAPDESSYEWVRAVFKEHKARIGVLCVHEYFSTHLERTDAGESFFEEVVVPCDNVYMVLCGHRYNQACVVEGVDADGDGREERQVYQIIHNYQAAEEGGKGYMRFLQFDTSRGELRVYSYSPYTGDYNYYDNPGAQDEKYAADPAGESYTLPLPWLAA